jgi:DNA-directed RNA polymerase subunit M/transcription elongation factor TFIIS
MSDEFFCFDCPRCGKLLIAHMEDAGRQVACSLCSMTMQAQPDSRAEATKERDVARLGSRMTAQQV